MLSFELKSAWIQSFGHRNCIKNYFKSSTNPQIYSTNDDNDYAKWAESTFAIRLLPAKAGQALLEATDVVLFTIQWHAADE